MLKSFLINAVLLLFGAVLTILVFIGLDTGVLVFTRRMLWIILAFGLSAVLGGMGVIILSLSRKSLKKAFFGSGLAEMVYAALCVIFAYISLAFTTLLATVLFVFQALSFVTMVIAIVWVIIFVIEYLIYRTRCQV